MNTTVNSHGRKRSALHRRRRPFPRKFSRRAEVKDIGDIRPQASSRLLRFERRLQLSKKRFFQRETRWRIVVSTGGLRFEAKIPRYLSTDPLCLLIIPPPRNDFSIISSSYFSSPRNLLDPLLNPYHRCSETNSGLKKTMRRNVGKKKLFEKKKGFIFRSRKRLNRAGTKRFGIVLEERGSEGQRPISNYIPLARR